jgi:hypothetical protein
VAKNLLFVVTSVIVAALFAALWGDLVLWITGRPTISDYLRTQPGEFWSTAALILVLSAILAFHLYGASWWGK